MSKRRIDIGNTRVCSDEFGVTEITVSGGKSHVHRKSPCEECPWRMDLPTHVFPPDAFRESAPTAYDGSMRTFSCHVSGAKSPATCAGYLLRHAENNIAVRLSLTGERIDLASLSDGGFPIYASYREMAIANGVPEDDPSLKQVRANDDEWDRENGCWKPRTDNE